MHRLYKGCLVLSILALIQGCTHYLHEPQSSKHRHVTNYDGIYYDYNNYYYDERTNIDYSSNHNIDYYDSYTVPVKTIHVPRSYHTSQDQHARSHKSRDKSWVKSQNPNGYTIELDNHNKASTVANTLTHAPKNRRTAQVKYNNSGKNRYSGVYGSYPSKAAANKALEKLPNSLRQKAGVKKWQFIQKDM